MCILFFQPVYTKTFTGTSLVVQWLRLQAPNARGPSSIPGQGTISHMPQLRPGAAAAKSLQSCPTLCDPIDGSPTGSPIPGILEARTLEWVAISFSNAWKWKLKPKSLSRAQLFSTPWTAAYQAPPSMWFFQARVLEWGAITFSKDLMQSNELKKKKRHVVKMSQLKVLHILFFLSIKS